jgi:hypothetical protein
VGSWPARGDQLRVIPAGGDLEQITMDPESFDQLVVGRSVDFIHYRAMPSPINKNDRGDLRRAEGMDGKGSRGFLFKLGGCFSGAILGNSKSRQKDDAGLVDYSTASLVLPRSYNKNGQADGERIYLQPGDRLYIKDLLVEVTRSELVQYRDGTFDQLVFPALCVEHLVDHAGKEYQAGYDFEVSADGNIRWLPGRSSPGVNADTGEGNVYSVRYHYNAHWYVADLRNEVRVISVTTDAGVREPVRMAYSAVIQREYVYHDIARDGTLNQPTVDAALPTKVDREPDPTEKEYDFEVEKSRSIYDGE